MARDQARHRSVLDALRDADFATLVRAAYGRFADHAAVAPRRLRRSWNARGARGRRYRSISPKTMSMEPRMAQHVRQHVAVEEVQAARWKAGARILQR